MLSMREDVEARKVRLADYRPPPYVAERAELAFALHPTATRVRSRIVFRSNPADSGEVPHDLRLDGRDLRLLSAAIDAAPIPQNALSIDPEGLTVAAAHVPREGF